MKEGERESWCGCLWAPQPEPAVQGSVRTSSGEQGWGHSKHTGAPSDSKLLWFEVNSRPVIYKRSCADEGDGNMGGLGPVSPSSALAVGWVLNVLVQRRYKYPQCVNESRMGSKQACLAQNHLCPDQSGGVCARL